MESKPRLKNTRQYYDSIISFEEMQELLPFSYRKLLRLCKEKIIPVVRVGKTYISSKSLIDEWIRENIGKEFD